MVTNEKQRKIVNWPITRYLFKTDKSWFGYRALTKIGILVKLMGRAILFMFVFDSTLSFVKRICGLDVRIRL